VNPAVHTEASTVPEADPAAQLEASTASEDDPAAQSEASTAPESPAVMNFTETSNTMANQKLQLLPNPLKLVSLLGQLLYQTLLLLLKKFPLVAAFYMKGAGAPNDHLNSDSQGATTTSISAVVESFFKDEDGYKEGDVLCSFCDKQSDLAALCLPVMQYNKDTSESGEDGSYVDDENQCCCGCGQDASGSCHYCL
jgi:hypothetical protein